MRAYRYDHVHLRSPGLRLAFIRGPDGIMVELVQQS